MASEDKKGSHSSKSSSSKDSSAGLYETGSLGIDALKPFEKASENYLQASISAQDKINKTSYDARLAYEEAVRKHDHDLQLAIIDANKKAAEKIRAANPSMASEECLTLQRQAQLEYEEEVRSVYLNSQNKMQEIQQTLVQKEEESQLKQYIDDKKSAYDQYLKELKDAWGNVNDVDPATIVAIASNVIATVGRTS